MNTSGLSGKTALVTGGSRGIGRAISIALGAAGVAVAVNYRNDEEAAKETQRVILGQGGQCEIFRADVADPAAVTAMVEAIENKLGCVDLLVTSAGIAQVASHTELQFADWQEMLRVNVDGTYLPVMALKDGMIERGRGGIVCIASIAGLAARAQMIPYSTSKAAVIAFARSCAEAFGPQVRVNCVAPGLIETDMTATMSASLKAKMTDEAFLKRNGLADDIAATVLFLLSDDASFTTGQTLVVDGGRITLP